MSGAWRWAAGLGAAAAFGYVSMGSVHAGGVDYEAVRKAIADTLEDESYDDGSLGPVLVRLAWHASGTYSKKDGTGGSNGAKMRFFPEAFHGANNGLSVARNHLARIKKQFPEISNADLWTLAACVAIEEMGGPEIAWRPGRTDDNDGKLCTPDDRLPDAAQGADHVRAVFGRMGFSDREMVALIGAHCLGRCHENRSGYKGPWTRAPTTFSNMYFTELVGNRWTRKNWDGPLQYEDPTGELMMLPADMALLHDPAFAVVVKEYAADEELFFRDFAAAFAKLLELGCDFDGPSTTTKAVTAAGVVTAIVGAIIGYNYMSSSRADSSATSAPLSSQP